MFRKAGRKLIWMLLGSTIFATLFGYALFRIGLISFHDLSKTQRAPISPRTRRVGRIRIS